MTNKQAITGIYHKSEVNAAYRFADACNYVAESATSCRIGVASLNTTTTQKTGMKWNKFRDSSDNHRVQGDPRREWKGDLYLSVKETLRHWTHPLSVRPLIC